MIGVVLYFKRDDGSGDYLKVEVPVDVDKRAMDVAAISVVNALGFDGIRGIELADFDGLTFAPSQP